MRIKKIPEVPFEQSSGFEGVKKQIVIGPKDGSEEIIIRHFTLEPGASTPRHTHDFPHLLRIEGGTGVAVDADGQEHPISPGDFVYVKDNELHNFKNTSSDEFKFTCTVPARGEA